MPTQENIQTVAEIKTLLENNDIAIITRYKGMNVAQVTNLRRKLRESGVEYKVFKNTLSRLALKELGLEDAAQYMDGPTAWAFCPDPLTPTKLLKSFGKEVKFVSMLGGVLTGQVVNKEQLDALADLPSREQLLAQVVGTIAAPLSNLVGVLNAVPRNFVNVLDQIREQKEKADAA